jgi:hypothetical protein
MVFVYAMQVLLRFGDDDDIKEFQNISLDTFKNILPYPSIAVKENLIPHTGADRSGCIN